MKLLCQIYRSSLKEEMYLFVDKQRGLEAVPEALMATFGEPEEVMLLPLTAERKLARADTAQVLAAIEDEGYYLQMPPTPAELLARERADE